LQPTRIEIDFEPNLKKDVGFSVGGYKGEGELDLRMYIAGDLNNSILVSENFTSIKPGEWRGFSANLLLPENLEPGTHVNYIVVEEFIEESEEGVGAIAGVKIPLIIHVPYPGRYIETIFKASNTEIGGDVDFDLQITNRGKQDLNKIFAIIDIYNFDEQKIDSLTTGSISLKKTEKGEINSIWNSVGNGVGEYMAVAIFKFDGETKEEKANFKIGDLLIEIINITGNYAEKNQIAKIEVHTESKWNNKIEGVYGGIKVYDSEEVVLSDSKTETTSFDPWEKKVIETYVDLRDVEIGEYDATAKIYYGNKVASKDFKIFIQKPKVKLFTFTNILMIVVAILVVLLMLSLIRKRRVLKKKKR